MKGDNRHCGKDDSKAQEENIKEVYFVEVIKRSVARDLQCILCDQKFVHRSNCVMLEKSIKRKIDTNVNPVKYHFPGLQHGKIITTLFASIISAILSVNVKGKFQDAAVWSRGSGRGFKST